MSRLLRPVTAALLCVCATSTLARADDDPWKPFQFLMGEWTGEGSGQPGKGEGEFSFALDLQKKVLVRRHHAEVHSSGNGAPAVLEDLMVVYREAASGRFRAIYFDSEDHVINYTVSVSDNGKTVTLLSDALQGAPRFRLTYVQTGNDTLAIKFEIARLGQADQFGTYVEGKARRSQKTSTDKSRDPATPKTS
jgi:hypothetical protein